MFHTCDRSQGRSQRPRALTVSSVNPQLWHKECKHATVKVSMSATKLLLALQIQNALSRAVKEQTVEKLERAFEQSAVVYGMRFKNLSVSCAPIELIQMCVTAFIICALHHAI